MADTQKSPKAFGEYFAELLQEKGISPYKFAGEIGVTRNNPSRWIEGGKPAHVSTVYSIGKALDLVEQHSPALWKLLKLYDDSLNVDDPKFQKAFIAHEGLPALDKAWLDSQPEEKRLGMYFGACRQQAGYSQKSLAAALEMNGSSIQHWEDGSEHPESTNLYKALKQMGLLKEEARPKLERMLELYMPTLDLQKESDAVVDSYVKLKGVMDLDGGFIKDKNTEAFGRYLVACCTHARMDNAAISKKSGIPEGTLEHWRKGNKKPDDISTVYKLTDALGLLQPENKHYLKQLLELWDPGLNWKMDEERLQQKFKKLEGLVALDEEWLNLQANEKSERQHDKRFGMYLGACLKKAGISNSDVMKITGVGSSGTVSSWMTGHSKPLLKHVYPMVEEIGLLTGKEVSPTLYLLHAHKLQRLMKLYAPDLEWGMDLEKLQTAFKKYQGNMGLDRQWLSQQKADRQFGLYLTAANASIGIVAENPELLNTVETNPRTIRNWELGLCTPKDYTPVSDLVRFYRDKNVPGFDADYLKQLWEKSSQAIDERNMRMVNYTVPLKINVGAMQRRRVEAFPTRPQL